MRDLKHSYLCTLASSLSIGAFFLSKMVVIGHRLSCFILIVYTMMSPPRLFLLIPLSLIPLMGLLSSSLP
jgi:hypothetical protein